MVEHQLPKLVAGVRFPSSAPNQELPPALILIVVHRLKISAGLIRPYNLRHFVP